MLKIKEIKNEREWLEFRKPFVTSTESSALYGLSPWKTAFELWHEKNGNIDGALDDNNFLAFGQLIEEPIAQMVMLDKPDWIIKPMNIFAYDDEDKIGSSYDREVTISNGQIGLMEIKSTSYGKFKSAFTEIDGEFEAPTHYEVQLQHELEVIQKYDFIVMVVFLADTRELKYAFRARDPIMGKEIRTAVKSFWNMDKPPAPDYERDKMLISKLAPSANPDFVLDATEDNRISELAAMYKAEKELEKQSKQNADKFYAELVDKLGKNRYAWTKDHKITCSDIKPNEGKIITADMVGNRIGARDGYKRLTITEMKK